MKTHQNMTNQEVADLLNKMAAALEVKSEDKFRIRAYENAADSIEHLSTNLKEVWQKKKLEQIPGVGKYLATHIDELFAKGNVRHFDTITKDLPQGMFALLDVAGIGPKTAFKLAKELKLSREDSAIKKLKQAAKSGKIRGLEGFAVESEKNLLSSIADSKAASKGDRILLSVASDQAEAVINHLKQLKSVLKIDPLGSLRRRMPTVGDVDLAVATTKAQEVIDHFVKFSQKRQVLAKGSIAARIKLNSGLQVDVKTQIPQKYGALLQHFTGSKNHNVHLREIAIQKGLSLSENGIKSKNSNKITNYAKEADFYQALGMKWIPPELREDRGEIEAALRQAPPKLKGLPNLVNLKDIKGDLHTHTDYDWIGSHDKGSSSIAELAVGAKQLGYQYLGIGDHNPSTSSYNNNKIITAIKKRKEKIDKYYYSSENKRDTRTIKLLNTLEVDIKPNGKLAVPDEGMNQLDVAIVSIHSSMRMSKTDMTKRVLEALSHPKAKILGHATGRLLLKRRAYQLDWEKVLDFCKINHKFIEINSQPRRMDVNAPIIRQAIKHQVGLVIGSDAHHASQMTHMNYGVDLARRGWAQRVDIVNALPWNQFRVKMNLK